MELETVEIENIKGELVIINKDDFDPKTMKLWSEKKPEPQEKAKDKK